MFYWIFSGILASLGVTALVCGCIDVKRNDFISIFGSIITGVIMLLVAYCSYLQAIS